MTEDRRPVALLPKGSTGYVLHDPLRGTDEAVTAAVARSLEPHAHAFYRPFAGVALDWRAVVRFGLQDCRRDLVAIVLTNAACGTLALLVPYATGLVFTSIIPGAQREQLLQLTLILLACALAGGMCQVTSTVALLRIDGRMGGSIQPALWDRLLSLPTTFFRLYSSGDLAVRAMGIDAMRQILSGTALTAVLNGAFSVFNLALLYYYDVRLAEWATALLLLAIGALVVVSRAQLGVREIAAAIADLGLVLQFLTDLEARVAAARVAGVRAVGPLVHASTSAAVSRPHDQQPLRGLSAPLIRS
jgi:ATP-binding cassette subfamily C protein